MGNDTVAASIVAPEVPWGPWLSVPSLIGPYDAGGAPTNITVTTDAVALMQPFDPAETSHTGNIWASLVTNSGSFSPLLLAPRQSGTINVTIIPGPSNIGKTVSGFLYVDTVNGTVNSGDEVVRIPYTYTVVR